MKMSSKIVRRLTLQRYLETISSLIEKLPTDSLGKNEKKRFNTIHNKLIRLIDVLAETTQDFTKDIHVTTIENAGEGKTKIYMKRIYLRKSEDRPGYPQLHYPHAYIKLVVNDNGLLPVNDPKDKAKPKFLIFHQYDFRGYVNLNDSDIPSSILTLPHYETEICIEWNRFDLTIPAIHPSSKNTYHIHGSHLELPSHWRKNHSRLDDPNNLIKDYEYYCKKISTDVKNKEFYISYDLWRIANGIGENDWRRRDEYCKSEMQ